MMIRQEICDDYEAVYALIKQAFDGAEHADGNEQDLVNALRESKSFVPELSLVAVIDGEIAGHILFTEAWVEKQAVLALAPLSVLPKYQRQGVGIALIQKGHELARRLGYGYSVVLGSEEYYPKAGYDSASRFGIKAPFDVPDKNFMACKLNENAAPVSGIMKYADEFGIG